MEDIKQQTPPCQSCDLPWNECKCEEESWKPVVGYEGLYMVSNTGRVKSLKRNIILKQAAHRQGYKKVTLRSKGHFVHRLVCAAFIGKSDLEVNHKDGEKANNKLDNLEYCSHSENVKHAYKNGLMSKVGSKHHRAKLSEDDVLEIKKLIQEGRGNKEISKQFPVTHITISLIRNNRQWSHVIL